jgi:hypothetical protein
MAWSLAAPPADSGRVVAVAGHRRARGDAPLAGPVGCPISADPWRERPGEGWAEGPSRRDQRPSGGRSGQDNGALGQLVLLLGSWPSKVGAAATGVGSIRAARLGVASRQGLPLPPRMDAALEVVPPRRRLPMPPMVRTTVPRGVTSMRHDGTADLDVPGVVLAILIAASGDENASCRPATSCVTGAGEPAQVFGAGFSGAPDCCREPPGLCPRREDPPDDTLQGSIARRGSEWKFSMSGSPGWTSARPR